MSAKPPQAVTALPLKCRDDSVAVVLMVRPSPKQGNSLYFNELLYWHSLEMSGTLMPTENRESLMDNLG
jgi:hypothetical protein